MSNKLRTHKRIQQWFIRGIGIVTVSFLVVIFVTVFFVFSDISTLVSPVGSGVKNLAEALWSVRVFDLFIIAFLLILCVIASSFLLKIDSFIDHPQRDEKRRL
ncbi:MAG: hypothetical protein K9W42_06945 [Candidatus Heimdallarchaeota archaeon]|nr:hypothetical protein [Candidatus Heimdallarchaeota archaeon]